MLAKRIIPCLDVKDGRTVKGVHFLDLREVGDPVALGAKYAAEGADELVYLDISATLEGRKTFTRLVSAVSERIDIPFTVGGGISSLADAAALLEAGADNARLNLLFFRKVSCARIKLEGLIYENMSFHKDGKVVVAIVTDEMLAAAGATEDDCDDLAGLPGRASCGTVSITIRDWPGGASKVSVRSGESFDSCALCARFGGGGHKMAAGCNLPVPPEQAKELLLQAIDEVWK